MINEDQALRPSIAQCRKISRVTRIGSNRFLVRLLTCGMWSCPYCRLHLRNRQVEKAKSILGDEASVVVVYDGHGWPAIRRYLNRRLRGIDKWVVNTYSPSGHWTTFVFYPGDQAQAILGPGPSGRGGRDDLWVIHLYPEGDYGDVDSWIEANLDMDENRTLPLRAPKVGRVRESEEDRASRHREPTQRHASEQPDASSKILGCTPKSIRRWAQKNGITYEGDYASGVIYINGRRNPGDLLSGDAHDIEVEPADFEGYEYVEPTKLNSLFLG